MALSSKAKASLSKVVDRFKSGDLSPIVKMAKIRLPEDAPARRWTFSNRVLAFAQSNSMDCRGYKQWQKVGRQVNQKGAAFILRPILVPDEDSDEEGAKKCVGFGSIPVHPYDHTQAMDDSGHVFSYEPQELPPLHDVADRLGVQVDWTALPAGLYGWCGGGEIGLGTHDVSVFFHELGHAAHRTFESKKVAGQDPKGEAIAEFTACVLMELYELGDRSGNAWEYISQYSKNPLTAVTKALKDVEKVLDIILADEPVQ